MQKNSGITKTPIFPFVFTSFHFLFKCDLQSTAIVIAVFYQLHGNCDEHLEIKIKNKVLVNYGPQITTLLCLLSATLYCMEPEKKSLAMKSAWLPGPYYTGAGHSFRTSKSESVLGLFL